MLAKVIAIFDFEAQESTDLGFKKGEEIEVLKKDGDWWSGRIGPNRTGNFPFNYVKVPENMDDSDPLAQGGIHKKDRPCLLRGWSDDNSLVRGCKLTGLSWSVYPYLI